MGAFLDSYSGAPSAGMIDSEQGTINPLVAGAAESIKAVGMMLGAYKPQTPEEASHLRRKFFADAAGLAVGTGATFALETGGASLTIPVLARAILSNVLGGAAGGAAYSGVEGGNVAQGALAGGIAGGVFGGMSGLMRQGAEGARAAAQKLAEEEAAKAAAKAAQPTMEEALASRAARQQATRSAVEARVAGESRAEAQSAADAAIARRQAPTTGLEGAPGPSIEETIAGSRGGIRVPFEPPTDTVAKTNLVEQMVEAMGLPPAQRAAATEAAVRAATGHAIGAGSPVGPGFADFGDVTVVPAPPGQAARVIMRAGGKGALSTKAVAAAVEDFRDYIRRQQPRSQARYPSRMRMMPRPTMPEGGPASELRAVDVGVKSLLFDMPEKPVARQTAWTDIQKIYRRGVQLAGNAIRKMGPAGQWVADTMNNVINTSDRIASKDLAAVENIFKGMKPKDRINVVEVLTNNEAPSSPANQVAATQVHDILENVWREGEAAGLTELSPKAKVRPFPSKVTGWPYTYSEAAVKKLMTDGSPERNDAIKRIMALRIGADTEEKAGAVLERVIKTPPEYQYENLQLVRDLGILGWEKDPLKVLPTYLSRSWRRIETAKAFGPQNQLYRKALEQIEAGGYDSQMVDDVFRVFQDKAPMDYNRLVRATRDFNVISLLSTGGIAQFAQHSNSLAYFGFKNYMRGLGAMFTKEGREWAKQTGAYLQELMGEVHPESVPTGMLNPKAAWQAITGPHRSAAWLQFIGLTPLDKANRMIAALAGRAHAEQLAEKYVSAVGRGAARAAANYERQLGRMGLSGAEVMRVGGKLTNEQALRAGQMGSHLTQFRGSVLDMPAWARTTTLGQFTYLFKTFAVQQFRFIHVLLDEAAHGNIGPIAKYLAASGTLTPTVGLMIQQLRARKVNPKLGMAWLEGAANAGAIGIAYDGLRAAETGPEYLFGFLSGPTISQAVFTASKAAKGDSRGIMRDVLRHAPLVGPALSEYLIPRSQ